MQESNDQYYWDQHKRSSVSPAFNRSVDSRGSGHRPDFNLRISSTEQIARKKEFKSMANDLKLTKEREKALSIIKQN